MSGRARTGASPGLLSKRPAVYPRRDRKGRRLRKGDRVRVIGIPDLGSMNREDRRMSEPVFRHIRGTCKRIAGFDGYGHAELFFVIRYSPHRGIHAVAMEPFLLLKQPD